MGNGRYRLRTWLRGRLPFALADLVPKGAHDCGAHEWHRADHQTWRCYHCKPGVTSSSPWTTEEQLQHSLGAIDSTLRELALRGEPGSEEELAELQRLVQDALTALPQEQHRLERLAATSAADLPDLLHALHTR
jgi:hypothetical protein